MSISESQSNSEPASDGLSGDVRLDVRSLCVGQVMEGALEVVTVRSAAGSSDFALRRLLYDVHRSVETPKRWVGGEH